MMSDKIQSTIVNTIPLWKSQMVIALGNCTFRAGCKGSAGSIGFHQRDAEEECRAIEDSICECGQESERGIVDIETL